MSKEHDEDMSPLKVLDTTAVRFYMSFRSDPRQSDGGWVDMIGPDDPDYKEAERRSEEAWKRMARSNLRLRSSDVD